MKKKHKSSENSRILNMYFYLSVQAGDKYQGLFGATQLYTQGTPNVLVKSLEV